MVGWIFSYLKSSTTFAVRCVSYLLVLEGVFGLVAVFIFVAVVVLVVVVDLGILVTVVSVVVVVVFVVVRFGGFVTK